MMALDDLRSFVEVVQSGGFNRAAKHLGISKSIVSRRMARLEAELGSRPPEPDDAWHQPDGGRAGA
jgi:DNA-binding transcriptional LysR family regulator